MRCYRLNSQSKYDLKVHLIWILKYPKRVLTGVMSVFDALCPGLVVS